jgi:hypothetical protein
LAFIAGLSACKSNQKVAYTPEQLVPTEKALLWKVTGNGLKKPSFVYGTIHMIPKNDFVLSEATRHAFDDAKRVTFEIDMKEMTNIRTQLSLMTKCMMAGGKTLKDLLPAEDYTFVKAKMDEKGLPGGMMERMKPMFLSMMFTNEEGGGSDALSGKGGMTSVEMELYRMARRRKIPSAGLETTASQIAIFDSIPYTAQARMLVDGLRGTDPEANAMNDLSSMLELYRNQDIVAMQNMVSAEGSGMGEYEDILLNRRNRNWIPEMAYQMRDKPTFFAVGAGHLGGPNGVVALLRKEGFRVEAQ